MQASLDLAFLRNMIHADSALSWSDLQLAKQLGFVDVEALETALQHSAVLRRQSLQCTERHCASAHHYMIQSSVTENSLSYLFYPFISAVLEFKTSFIAAKQSVLETVYAHYFQLDALALEQQQSINEMDLCFDLLPAHTDHADIQLYGLCRALLDPDCQQVYMIAAQGFEGQQLFGLAQIANIELHSITPELCPQNIAEIDFKQLFWKRKTTAASIACQKIAYINAPLLSLQLNVPLQKAEHLIDDLLYSEHIFEKLSVFGEYSDTILKQHHLTTSRAML